MKKALIAMSGGVDSSAAALLTLQAGYECIGCTMKLHDSTLPGAPDDAADAKAICSRLGIPHYIFDFRAQFREQIIGKFVRSYQCGKTPNPCIDCNRCMKFSRLLECAAELGCDHIVTGHYARVLETAAGFRLCRGTDLTKDQSYVLYMLTQEQLSHVLLPLGGLTKQAVRQLAESQGFVNARKRDSQDICFVPDGDYARVIREETGTDPVPGEFVDLQGNVLGQHNGLIHYTVGQRRGLGIAVGKPAYVVALEPEQNRVVIGDNADLFRHSCTVCGVNWIAGAPPQEPVRCQAKIRYRHPAQPATVLFTDAQTALLTFDEPQRAITAGQAAVFYDGETVLGGGEIFGVSGT